MDNPQDKIPRLSLEQIAELKELLNDAFGAAASFNGSEEASKVLEDTLSLIENFVNAHRGEAWDVDFEELQRAFARQAGVNDARSAFEIFDETLDVFYSDLKSLDLETVLQAMKDAGAGIVYSDGVYVETDEGEIAPGEDPDSKYVPPHFIPKLVYLLDVLRELPGDAATYIDDVVVHVGKRRENMLRQQPYLVVDIPWMNKQIALCNESGQTTFLYDGMINPEMYVDMPKSLLKGIDGMRYINFSTHLNWKEKIRSFLSSDLPKKRTKPNAKKEAEAAETRKMSAYTLDMVLAAAKAEYMATGRRPVNSNTDPISYKPMIAFNTSWSAIDRRFVKGKFKVAGYSGLADFLDQHRIGVYTLDDVLMAAKAEYAASVKAGEPRRPNAGDADLISFKPMDAFHTNWKAVNRQIKVGRFKNAGYDSLSDFLNKNGVGVPTLDDVLASARAEYAASVKAGQPRRPSANHTDLITFYPMAEFQISWKAVDAQFKTGQLKDSGYDSLSDFLNKNGVINGQPLPVWRGDDLGTVEPDEVAPAL